MNLLFYVLSIGIILVITLVSRIAALPHKNILFQTTLPHTKLRDPQVLAITQKYSTYLWIIALSSFFGGLPLLFLSYDSLKLLYFLALLFGYLAIYYYLQLVFIQKMTSLKIRNHWKLPKSPIIIDTALVLLKNRKLVSNLWFLPSFFITICNACYLFLSVRQTNHLWIIPIVILILLSLVWIIYKFVARFPVNPLTSDIQINRQVNDLVKHYWSSLLVISAFLVSLVSFIPLFILKFSYAIALMTIFSYSLILFIFIILSFFTLLSYRKKQDQFISQAKEYHYKDEDQYWKYAIYMNPEDPKIFVPNRVDTNLTINVGRPAGKILLAVTGLIVTIAIAVALIPLFIADFSTNPFKMNITTDNITIQAPLTQKSTIKWTEVESVQLVNQLPKNPIRVFGLATDTYLIGSFLVDKKKVDLFVETNETPILEIKTKERNYFYTNKNADLTKDYFARIQEKIKNEDTLTN